MRIGVVLPVFNGAPYLSEALDSIAAQTLQPSDVVAVDDGSTDRSPQILREHGIRVLHTDRVGQALARDHGIKAVDGEVLAFLDQDDRWCPDKLTHQLAVLEAQPHIDFVGSLCTTFLQPGTQRPPWWKPDWDDGAPEPSLAPGATLYRRNAFASIGGFHTPGIQISEDVAWTARAHDAGLRSTLVDQVLLERRIHGDNTSRDQVLRVREHLAIARASIARKRATDG
ncbi:glycosyltransferase family A protein [Mycobacterium sp. shizuoka-1]|uniref:glycosyltransferase family 2 protein n=1 Tax=Mycobacterium sp. shizuoka-1 TaxID=2039281 RepID=UPI000C060E96|nr:glycosyltransferase family A protein [Mycobacterium sp. shizuoka-1]GAY14028.1 glycosyl transferase family A [Mycobacterium sp. shizuoka-1]